MPGRRETILLDIPSLLYPRSTYDAHIRPYLFGMADAPGAGSTRSGAAYGSFELDPRTGLRTGEVAPGQTVTGDAIPSTSRDRARLLVRWKDTPLKASLRDPTGASSRKMTRGAMERTEYVELGFADFASYVAHGYGGGGIGDWC